jgi:hypothetical protein
MKDASPLDGCALTKIPSSDLKVCWHLSMRNSRSIILSYSYKICTINFRSNYLVTSTFSLSHLPSALINGLAEVVRSKIDSADFIEA